MKRRERRLKQKMKKEEQLKKKIDEDAANAHAADVDDVHCLWTHIVSLCASVQSYLRISARLLHPCLHPDGTATTTE